MSKEFPQLSSEERSVSGEYRIAPSQNGMYRTERKSPFEWWYRLTAPKMPSGRASFAQREIVRRGRLASVILLFSVIFALIATPDILAGHSIYPLIFNAVSIAASIFALFLNRRGLVNLSGLLVVLSITLSFTVAVITSSTAGITSLLTMELMCVPELFAVSLLPPITVIGVTAYNCVFIWIVLTFLHHSAELDRILQTSRYFLTFAPMVLYITVALVTLLFANNVAAAIKRADLAEEIAILEQRERELQQREIDQKMQLDTGIKQILQTHVQVANGNFKARAPLTQENLLWQIGFSLNNLLARLESYSQVERDFAHANAHMGEVIENVRQAKMTGRVFLAERKGTFLDPLVLELNGQQFKQSTNPLRAPRFTQYPGDKRRW